MTEDEQFASVIEHRRRLAEVLAGLDADQWEAPSLCRGWRVRDVVGHLLSILELPIRRWTWESVKAGSFDRYADRIARATATRPVDRLLAGYRAHIDDRFAPPVVGPLAPLVDVCVHTRDIERPLGIDPTIDTPTMCFVLDYLTSGRRGLVPPARTRELRFVATDLDWSAGHGHLVTGPGDAIVSATAGRVAAVDALEGRGAAILRARLTC